MSLLAARRVTRSFGDVAAVSEVDLTVEAGEVVGLLGANGAGKTTLIRLALGLLRPTAGRVALFDAPPDRRGRLRLGYVPQGLGLYEDLTVDENLAFASRAFGRPIDRSALDDDLRSAGSVLVQDLPLGLRRRVAFAAALGHDPELLVLDEPTSGVEPLARARLWETIRGAAERGAGVLATTHHMAEASECDRLVVMVAGRVAAAGSLEAIVGRLRTVTVVSNQWERTFRLLDGSGMPVALVGRSLHLPGGDVHEVVAMLRVAGIEAEVDVIPATFEEAFVRLAATEAA